MSQELTTSKPKILVFCRNYLVPDFHSNFDPVNDDYEIKYLTDQKCKYGTEDTRSRFYNYLNNQARCTLLDKATEEDVIARCRLLRNLETTQASKMAHAMALVVNDVLVEYQPDLLFTHMVDEYILHLFCIFAERKQIAYAAYCGSYFPGHSLIFSSWNGSPLPFREPHRDEVDEVLEKISPVTFRQNYAQVKDYTIGQHLRLMLRHFIKKFVFPVKSLLENDPWGMHYKIVPFCADRKSLKDFPDKKKFIIAWRTQLDKLKENAPAKIVIYFPLSYHPEATTDYWVNNKSIIDYENKALEIIRLLAKDCILLVKEHAHMMGARHVTLHDALSCMDSVISIHPEVIGNEVLLASDAVLLGSGSAGVETFLRDKPVFTYCETSYWFKSSKAYFLDLNQIENWAKYIKTNLQSHLPVDTEEKKRFIYDCLRSTTRTKLGGNRWPLIFEEDLKFLINILLTKVKPENANKLP